MLIFSEEVLCFSNSFVRIWVFFSNTFSKIETFESFFVSFGVNKVLLETLDESFKEWGVYHGSKNYPTWHHIKWRLEEKLKKTLELGKTYNFQITLFEPKDQRMTLVYLEDQKKAEKIEEKN